MLGVFQQVIQSIEERDDKALVSFDMMYEGIKNELRGEIESVGFNHYYRHWAHALHAPFWWLKCLFWKTQDSNWFIAQYHRFLVWDLMDKPVFTRVLEKAMNPVVGKSVVMYFRKDVSA